MITVIEIPHQKPPRIWSAYNVVEAIDVCAQMQPDRTDIEGLEREDLQQWLDDNHQAYILEDIDDWRAFFGENAPRHQRAASHAAARRVIRENGAGWLAWEPNSRRKTLKGKKT